MKVAIPHWQGRVSPVLDVAGSLLIAEVTDGVEVGRHQVALTATDPLRRAQQLVQTGASVLICGAISWPLESALIAAGLVLHTRMCGQVEEVLEAFRKGKLGDAFTMPGCCRKRRMRGRTEPGGPAGGCHRGRRQPRRPNRESE